jgi:class 3 adenylate cyclase/tetratricopeptide (TPR) repeat protein
MACGASLARACPVCGAEAAAGARFCIACGAQLDRTEEPSPTAGLVEERRLVTVLFADLSGYTSVAERLDHETVKALVERCLTRLASEVDRYGGRVDKFIGDNVMAVFGAPVAHEDDAERAVRAALGMQAAMLELNETVAPEFGFELALRVGLNTGEVLAGRVGDEYTVTGDTVNVAARLQAAASVGGILVGDRTRRGSEGAIAYRRLEPLALKGKAERVTAWEATGLREEAEPEGSRTPLVGREDELAQLERLFERADRDSAPHLVTVVGQPGVGKSRLLSELEHRLGTRERPVRVLHGRCLAFGQGVVYWPLAEMLRAECGIAEGDTAQAAWIKLSERFTPLLAGPDGAGDAERRLEPIALVVGAEPPGTKSPPELDEEHDSRESFFGAVRSVFDALATERPLLLAWEDIHWADEGTLDLIEYLGQWLRTPVLQVCLARDELLDQRPEWGTLRRTATVTFLEPLSSAEARELIGALVTVSGATTDLLDTLAERSGGNPLFAETIVRRIAEEEDAAAAELPDTVQGLLAARLDALDPAERELVAQASVIGRTFSESALRAVADAAGADLSATLQALREKDLIVLGDRGASDSERELSFKHVLIRDVAYGMLPKAIRARKHAQVAAFLELRAGERGEGIAALLAEHYGQAAALAAEVHLDDPSPEELNAKALVFSEAAGDAAAALFSNREALDHYAAAVAFATADPPTELRIAEKQGDVALRLGRVEVATESWRRCLAYWRGQDEPEHVAELHRKIGAALAHKGERKAAIEQHQQGINLIKDLPPSLALVRLYEEAAWLYMQVGDNMLAIYAAEKALRLAEQLQELRAASRAHGIFGRVFGRIGDIAKARENLERAVELARDSDPSETVLALLALGQHLEQAEGDYGAAEGSYVEGLTLAERIGDVPAQIELHAALAQLGFYRCDWEEVRRASDASAELAEHEGLVGKLCLPRTLRGVLRWREGNFDASAEEYSAAHELAEQVGWSEVSFSALFGLATTLRDRGDFSGAELILNRALAVCERAGLIAQSIQAHAAVALTRALQGSRDQAREAAAQAATLSERVAYPVGRAAALEARGIAGELPDAKRMLDDARAAWTQLGRPLDVARCELLLGGRLRDQDLTAASEALARAAELYDQLGVSHLAQRSRELQNV